MKAEIELEADRSTATRSRPDVVLVSVDLDPVTRTWRYRFVKRAIDIVVSALGLVVLSPLLLLLALLVRLTSRGPAFYHWNVVGRGGRPFRGYKFRTMVSGADEIKDDLAHLNEMQGPVFKIKDDPRITRLGKILRKYSLDELPQLLSVLKGEMSLVGPRPPLVEEWVAWQDWQRRKLTVTPGITCTWQTNGRNHVTDFYDWVRMDLNYIDNWSLALDAKVLAKTARSVVLGTGS